MGVTLHRSFLLLVAAALLTATAWAKEMQFPTLQPLAEAAGVAEAQDPGYGTIGGQYAAPGDVSYFGGEAAYDAGWSTGCTDGCSPGCNLGGGPGCNVGCSRGCRVGCNRGCQLGCGVPYTEPGGFLGNTYGFFAGDAWRNQMDDNNSNNFGIRAGLNGGIPLLRARGIGVQIGGATGAYDLLGRDGWSDRTVETQTILTAGLFKRSSVSCGDPISWAVVYDFQFHNHFGEKGADYIDLGQFRAQIGVALDAQNEIGCWVTQTDGEREAITEAGLTGQGTFPTTVQPVNQYNVFWHRHWECGGDTMVYAGVPEDPGEFVIGLRGTVPLNRRWALFYGLHYIKPSAGAGHPQFEEEIWNVTGGVVFYPCWNAIACNVSGNRWMPLLPVADNGSFALDQDLRIR
jgi:hypothetical protein